VAVDKGALLPGEGGDGAEAGGAAAGGSGASFAAAAPRLAQIFPTLGIDSLCPVRFNTGSEPFSFDLTDQRLWVPLLLVPPSLHPDTPFPSPDAPLHVSFGLHPSARCLSPCPVSPSLLPCCPLAA